MKRVSDKNVANQIFNGRGAGLGTLFINLLINKNNWS